MDSARRIVMAREVASRWLTANTRPEYRIVVHFLSGDKRFLPAVVKSFRDKTATIGNVPHIPDLGMSESYGSLELWSSDGSAIRALSAELVRRGFEVSEVS